jgi:murein DD-endopeptidase MepM/ murein hydrolase activator NlpD
VLAVREETIAQKKAVLTGLRTRQERLERIEEQLAQESSQIEALLAQAASSSPTSSSDGSTPAAPAPAPDGGGQLLWPADGPLTSGYGMRVHPIFGTARMHTGIDIGAAYGSPVWAADDGRVAYVGAMSGYGNTVVIDHGGGLATTYNHLSGYQVSSGQTVARGQPIATVGCTGYCTGPHLHFEVRIDGSPVDPMPYLR